MIELQLKNDDGFYIIILIILAIQFVFVWMRLQLKKIGREYPLFNKSFLIYGDFMSQLTTNKDLKIKFRIILISIFLILFALTILIISD